MKSMRGRWMRGIAPLGPILELETFILGATFLPIVNPNEPPDESSAAGTNFSSLILHFSVHPNLMSMLMLRTFAHQAKHLLEAILKNPEGECTIEFVSESLSGAFDSPNEAESESMESLDGMIELDKSSISVASSVSEAAGTESSEDSLSLLSSYTHPLYEAELARAQHPLKWLTLMAHDHPDRVAHEIYTADDLRAHEEDDGEHEEQGSLKPSVMLTYGELNRRANAVAKWLLSGSISKSKEKQGERGNVKVKREKICVCMERDAAFYVIMAAIWKAGGIYCSIDPTLPVERKRYIVKDSGSKLVFVHTPEEREALLSEFEDEDEAPIVSILEDEYDLERCEPVFELSLRWGSVEEMDVEESGLDDVSYLLYTSGTTGKPKGCLLTYRGVYHAITGLADLPRPITNPETDKRLAMASIAFDVHISEIVISWALGIRLVSAPSARFELLSDLRRNIWRLGVTHLGMVPSMIEATFQAGNSRGGAEEGKKVGLKYLASGGEKISDSLMERWSDHPSLILANAYGPTEATIGCTLRRVHKNDRKENLGWPMKSCRTFVVHPSSGSESPFMVVPRGVPGELVLAGPLVGVGYHNNKEATRKAFIEWPEKGAMAYRTGDLVRMMPDGALEILGRVDSQIKLRGVRIEAEGISNVLREAAAAASDDPRMGYVTVTIIATHLGFGGGGNEQLVTFIARGGDKKRQMQRRKSGVLPDVLPLSQDSVVSSSSFPLEIMAKIKEASSKELASYMRPSHIIPIAYIPLNPSGKTDGKLLRSLFSSTDVSTLLRFQRGEEGMRIISDGTNGDEGDGDEDAEERFKSQTYGDLSNILREILPAQSVTLKSNLFEAGLDSFGFGALSRLIKKKLLPPGCKPIRVAELMSFSDLRQLVSAIDETRRAPSKSPSAANPQPNPYSNEPEGEKESLITAFDEKWRASAEGIFNPGDIECVLPPLPVQEGVLFRTLQQPGHYVQHFSYRCSDVIDIRRVEDAWKRLVEQTQILRSCFVVGDTLLQVVLTPQAATLPFSEHEVSSMTVDEFIEWFRVNAAQKIAEDITDDVTVPLFRVNLYTSEEAKYMVLSINHVAYDGISIPVMLRNLACHYEGLQVEHPSPTLQSVLEELPFLDSDGARRFWTSQLDSIKAHYHARHLSPPKPPMREHLLSDLSYSNITQRCRSLGISFQALCTAAYGIVHRNTFHLGEDQSLFGVVRSGRSLAVDNINFAICPLVCVVPTLVDFGVTDTTQLLRNVQRFISETTSYEHMSVGRIRRWIGGSSLPIDSLFSCRFKFRSEPVCSDAFQHINTEHPLAEFILSIEILVDADADTLDIRAAFTEPELSLEGVRTFLQALEKTVEDLISSPPPGIVELVPSGHGSLAPTPASEPEGSSAEHAIPSAELEETVAGHVCQLLRVQKKIVRPTTSLISIGLDSLRSVALSRMLSEDGIDVSAVDIVQADSIRKLLQRQSLAKRSHEPSLESFAEIRRIRQELENALKDQDLKLSPEDETLIIPATSLQAGMLSQTLASKGELYVHGFTFRLDSCEIDAVRKSWTRAIRRFDILRTSFHFAPVSGRWAQVIHTDADVRWSTKHYSDSANFVEDLTRSLSFKDPIDFSRSPLHLRLAVLHEENYLVVVLHHVLYDAVSLPKLFSFVRQDLMGASTSAIPPQLQDIIDDVLVQETDGANFWADSLKGFHPPHISRDRSVSSDAWRSSLTLDLDSAVIDRTCRRYQISSQSIMQLAWAKVLANRYQNVDVVFGQVVSGRALPKAMDVVAPLFNTVPMRVKFYKGRTNKDMVRTVHQFNIAAIPWQHASLRTVQKRIGVSNICDTLFLFQPNVTEEDDRGTRPLELAHKEAGEVSKTQYALNVEVSPLFRGYNISASCSSQVMDLDALKRTLKEFSGAIFDIVNRPNESALPLSFSFNERGSEHAIPDHPITDGEPEEWWTEERLLLRDVVSKFASVPLRVFWRKPI
ncbi:uncharacterized protein EI90DRAFT_1704265 [Cantharellus anzutake]|uniref:uncharacterized protein n=1 Tax=Cantharellus anzutake TaxID=1750568 RepID=UPI001904349A|nr:uncharacterized protein EI90DRAFT_1704265 [Cantharellus anzutake]KAF8341217.1 hypothetical protein EI90DRAFT_1704265 [Cantharellus anzutake]